jgi:hypothetical protein
MPPNPADDAGPRALRVDFPGGPGRTFAWLFFPVLAAPFLVLFLQVLRSPADAPSRSFGLAVFAAFLALIAAGLVLTLRILRRKPTALEVREKGLVLFRGSRAETVGWSEVRGLNLVVFGIVPTHVVLFEGGRRLLPIGSGERARELSREIARRADLRWVEEPFTAVRRTSAPPSTPGSL